MHWIVQDNLYHEHGFTALAETLRRFDIPHDVVKVLPFSDHLQPHEQTEPVINPEGPVMVCGSTTLAKIAKRRGWTPGSFLNENHDYRVWKQHYGQHLLNADARVCRFADVEPIWSPFFIRPCEDSKSFSGALMDWSTFEEWRHRVVALKETYTSLNGDTMVSYGPVQTIIREARFFVVDGRVITQSTYKVGSRVHYDPLVDTAFADFAQQMVDLWAPARAFVIDCAVVKPNGAPFGVSDFKIVEINCINSAGFYAIDVQKFVMAIEEMGF